jgi:hypothetical protein
MNLLVLWWWSSSPSVSLLIICVFLIDPILTIGNTSERWNVSILDRMKEGEEGGGGMVRTRVHTECSDGKDRSKLNLLKNKVPNIVSGFGCCDIQIATRRLGCSTRRRLQ